MNSYASPITPHVPWALSSFLLQTPAGDIPMRSVSLASDSSCLVAGNNKARTSPVLYSLPYHVSELCGNCVRGDAMSGRLMKRVQVHRVSRQSPSFKLTVNTSPGCCSVRTSSEMFAVPMRHLYVTLTVIPPISRYLATCSADTTVKIWSVSPSFEFRLDKILQGHQRWVWDCAFSADSAYLVTGGYSRSPPAPA